MFNALLRWLGFGTDRSELEAFEPIYGLPTRSLDEWLSRNPQLKKEYEIELAARLRRDQSIRDVKARRGC
jgi:hypothetical protein